MREEFLGEPVDSLTETIALADQSMTSRRRCQHFPSLLVPGPTYRWRPAS
jgi:hypothetical protein